MVDVGKVRVNLCLDGKKGVIFLSKLGQGQESKFLAEKHILGEGRARGELGELALGSPKEASTFWTRELSELGAICLGSPWARFGLVLKNPESLAGLGRAAWGRLGWRQPGPGLRAERPRGKLPEVALGSPRSRKFCSLLLFSSFFSEWLT
ncbi:hypothetical protein LWI29_007775 [Acer saccharum]|uniref:Uncharacterized protein n=1 Tax=Acer saccharum TaxID=4024 RepID=A0AA39RL09_ACESA|nr:hypothetical protein LWI29_007775 [Acer saccharum]